MTIAEYKQQFLDLHAKFEEEHGVEISVHIMHRYKCRTEEFSVDCEISIE